MSTSGQDEDHRIYSGSRLLAVYSGGMTYFYNSDQLGTDRVVTDRSGVVDETCTGLPYGDSESCARGTPPVRPDACTDTGRSASWESDRFAGYDIDRGTGLCHAPARYYSPGLGRPDAFTHTGRSGICRSDRFMTPDPFGTPPAKQGTCSLVGPPADKMTGTLARPESLNRYAYAVDNPATFGDPTGNFVQEEPPECYDNPFLAECQCDPINGCPPDLLILMPPSAPTGPYGPCVGTRDCSWYAGQYFKARTVSSISYYCLGGPFVCKHAGTSPFEDCVRLCLQASDNCLNLPDSYFTPCEAVNHARCFSLCHEQRP